MCDPQQISSPLNGRVNISSTTLGSVAAYECDSGFVLLGNPERVCEIEGWSGNNPTCGSGEFPTYLSSWTETEENLVEREQSTSKLLA